MQTQTVKTTVELYTDVWKDVKLEALERGLSIKHIINENLRRCRAKKPVVKRKSSNGVKFGNYDVGKIIGSLHRRDIYDWL